MARKKKAEAPAGGCPEWMVTYGDMMGLLLCFFVIIASMSELKRDEVFLKMVSALRIAFNNPTDEDVEVDINPNSLLEILQSIVIPQRVAQGDSDDPGIRGKVFRVTDVREGVHVEIGGRITFARFSAQLRPEAEYLAQQLAAKTIGHNTIIKITGHATNEPLPPESSWADAWDLSYARARAVRDVLIASGIRPERLRLVAAGAEAPVRPRAYDEETRAVNRRVEIVVTEATVDEYLEADPGIEEQEPTDG